MRDEVRFEGLATPAEAAAAPYRYIPFTAPPRCTRIDVAYDFAAGADESPVIDIGLFDTRGTAPLTGGFRGWSGSARRQFFLARDRATPGYLAGPLPAGTWSVVLGLYTIPEPGVRWSLTIATESGDRDESDPPDPPQALRRHAKEPLSTRRWIPGDLHSHSEHSDGANPIGEIASFALERGLRFLAITDHNTVSHHTEVDAFDHPRLLLIPGEEVTTYSGHANTWGLREWIDFRVTTDEEMHRLFRWVDARGAPFSMNHPKSVGPPWLLCDPGFAIREVWQAPWRWYNWESVRDWEAELVAGRRVIPVGGSDAHSVPPAQAMHPHHVGDPTTWVQVEGEVSEAAILAAITAGRTTISESPTGPFLALAGGAEGDPVTAEWERAGGCALVVLADGEERHRVEELPARGGLALPANLRFDRYLRAELRTHGPLPGDHELTRALAATVWAGKQGEPRTR